MKASDRVRKTMLDLYERISNSDVGSFEKLVALNEASLVIGTAPGEWVTEPDRLRAGFEIEGVRLEPGEHPQGWQEGSVGWFADEPTMFLPDGTVIRTRLLAVLRDEGGSWKLQAAHYSAGVPDDEVTTLQKRWLG